MIMTEFKVVLKAGIETVAEINNKDLWFGLLANEIGLPQKYASSKDLQKKIFEHIDAGCRSAAELVKIFPGITKQQGAAYIGNRSRKKQNDSN